MNQLIVIPPIAVPMCLADAEMAQTLSFAMQEKSEGTRRAYGSDWKIFRTWCDARGLESLPASAGTVCVSACKFDPLSRGIGVQN
jgi:hypothetical protein